MMIKRLDELVPPQNASIHKVNGSGALRQRMMDMGLVPGADIEVVRVAPMGDPVEYRLKGYHLSLRGHEARNILVDVDSIVLEKTRAGDTVRILSLSTGKMAAESLRQLGLHPGDTLRVLKNGASGKLLIQRENEQIEVGRGLAGKILVETLPAEGAE